MNHDPLEEQAPAPLARGAVLLAALALLAAAPGALAQLAFTTTHQGSDEIVTFIGGSGAWIPPSGVTNVRVLVVAGGGGGGYYGGGGGAGGLIYTNSFNVSSGTQTVTVGGSGTGATGRGAIGANGANSVFGSITAYGGGGGGSRTGDTPARGVSGAAGGSGGGGSPSDTSSFPGLGGAASPSGQGNAGGKGGNTGWGAGGGSGAGAAGADATGTSGSSVGGAGGAGLSNDITGAPKWYAGGGGGATYSLGSFAGAGGIGGGGAGAQDDTAAGTAGTANTGGGGGGGGYTANGGAGGSGVVIIRYTARPVLTFTTLNQGADDIVIFTDGGGTWTPPPGVASVEVLVVASGGGGGFFGGGGGAGGLIHSNVFDVSGGAQTVTVGYGGPGAMAAGTAGSNGQSSVFGSLTAVGGGGGGSRTSDGAGVSGGGGGSGGGGSATYNASYPGLGGAGTSGQGNVGGNGGMGVHGWGGGGGSGAGAAGSAGTDDQGGNGGVGLTCDISGSSTYYAGGGGGGTRVDNIPGFGGAGGGGAGSSNDMAGTDGTANTGGGGGGGGGYWNFQPGGTGGSGVVIVRYPHNGTIPSTFSWNTNGSAGWSGGVNWTNNLGGTDVWSPGIGGQTNYTLNFNQAGIYTATNDLRSGFLLNQLNFGGPTLTLSGNSLEFTGTLPQINQNSSATITVGNNLILDANTTFGGSGAGTVTLNGAISGAGSLTKVGPGKLVLTGNNTYSGATTLSSGTLKLDNMMAIVTPTAATAESYYVPGDRAPGHTIDGSGMTPSSPVTVAGYNGAAPTSICDNSANSTTWLSNGNTPSWITFDLGSNQTIIGFHLWNYNENSGNPSLYTERGVNSASIYTETSLMGGSGVGTLVQNMTFAQATGATSYTGADYTFGSPVTARYIEIYANTNFGGDNYTGLSEIRFFTSASSGTLPTGTALSIAAGATFDVSVYANYILGAGALLTASGTGAMVGSNAAVITGAAGGTVSLGARPILLIWSGAAAGTDGAHPALVISQGNLSLNGNTFTVVVAGTALSNGVYTLITTPSAISGTVNPTPSFAGGHGLDGGRAGVVSINGNNVILTIDSATPPTLGAPQALGGNLILTGTGGTANAGYTWLTATNLSAPIKWITNSTGTLDGTGAFSNAIPVPATPPANFFKLRLP